MLLVFIALLQESEGLVGHFIDVGRLAGAYSIFYWVRAGGPLAVAVGVYLVNPLQ